MTLIGADLKLLIARNRTFALNAFPHSLDQQRLRVLREGASLVKLGLPPGLVTLRTKKWADGIAIARLMAMIYSNNRSNRDTCQFVSARATSSSNNSRIRCPPCGQGKFQGTFPLGNNASGAVTGYYVTAQNIYHGFLRTPDGTITSFDPPGAGTLKGSRQGTYAISIDGKGQIVGQYQDENNLYHGFLRAADGGFTTIDAPGAGTEAEQGTVAANIRPDGVIVGYYVDSLNSFHGFVRLRDGVITTFDAPGAGTAAGQGTVVSTTENNINREGDITSWYIDGSSTYHGYVRSPDGTFTIIDGPDATGTIIAGVSSKVEVGGYYFDSTFKSYGLLYQDGALTTFQDPAAALGAGQGTDVFDINTEGAITGQYVDVNYANFGYVRSPNGRFTNFSAPHASGGNAQTFYTGTWPESINSAGEVAGYYYDKKTAGHGFVWKP